MHRDEYIGLLRIMYPHLEFVVYDDTFLAIPLYGENNRNWNYYIQSLQCLSNATIDYIHLYIDHLSSSINGAKSYIKYHENIDFKVKNMLTGELSELSFIPVKRKTIKEIIWI